MRHRASKAAGSSTCFVLVGLLFATVLVLMLCRAISVEAQETTAEQTVAQGQEATSVIEEATMVAENENTVSENEETTTGAAERDRDANEIQNSRQRDAHRDQDEPSARANDPQVAATQTGPLTDETAQITESTDDRDQLIANRVVIPNVDCEVSDGASVTVRDADGTEITLTDGDNVDVEEGQGRIVIVGLGEDQNFDGVNIQGGDFGPSDGTETGTVVRSTGITCDRNDGGDADEGDADEGDADEGDADEGDADERDEQGDGSCDGAEVVESVGPTTTDTEGDFQIAGETFRVTYEVDILQRDEFPTAIIDIGDRLGSGPFVQVSETERDSFISTEGPGSFDFTVQVDPPNTARYEVTVEDCTGVGDDDNDDILNVPNDDLPDTGGLPLPVLMGCALVLAGASLIGAMAVRRGQ